MAVAASQRKLTWKPAERYATGRPMERLQESIDRWIGTPYMENQKARGPGGGVDCVRFVEGVLEDLYDLKITPRRILVAQDASVHDRRSVTQVAQELARRYPHQVQRRDIVHPGDVVICKVGKGPGHSVIIGPKPYHCYQALPTAGVQQGGVGSLVDIARVIHMHEKDRWV